MGHIHTEHGQHDLTTSAFIIRIGEDEEPKLILHMHKKLNRWLQFGGHVELDENPWQAIAREIEEESGYTLDQLKFLQPVTRIKKLEANVHPQPICVNTHVIQEGHYHTDLTYAFTTSVDPANPRREGESDEIRSFTMAELAQEDNIADMLTIGTFVIDEIFGEWLETDCPETKAST